MLLKPPGGGASSTAWLITFADLAALMLTFFVLLFAMQTVEQEEWRKLTEALSLQLDPDRTSDPARPDAELNLDLLSEKGGINLDYLATLLESRLRRDGVLSSATVQRLADRLVLSLPGGLMFEPGSAALSPEARSALFQLGGLLRHIRNRIEVAGHTDPRPTMRDGRDLNWEISIARAVVVANELRRSGYPRDIVPFGHADGSFASLPAAIPLARRYALARRVDVIVRAAETGF